MHLNQAKIQNNEVERAAAVPVTDPFNSYYYLNRHGEHSFEDIELPTLPVGHITLPIMSEYHLKTEKPILSLIHYVADNVRSLCQLERTESLARVTADRYCVNNSMKAGMDYYDTKIFGKTQSYFKKFVEPKNMKCSETDPLIVEQNRKCFGAVSRSMSSIQQAIIFKNRK